MSTKTTFKRIALVAVVALGLGGLSTVPASADNTAAGVNSISLAKVTSSPKTGSAVAVNFLANVDDVADGGTNVFTFTGYLSSYPAGGFAQVTFDADEDVSTTDTELFTEDTEDVAAVELSSGATYTSTLTDDDGYTGNTAVATSAIGAAQLTFTPTVAGTYVMTVWNDADTDDVIDFNESVQTISITVAAAATLSAGTSSALSQPGNDNAATPSTTTNALPINASSTAADANRAAIMVSMNDSDNNAMATGNTITASVTGPGYLVWDRTDATTDNDSCSATPTYSATTNRSITAQTADAVGFLYLCSDNTAGTSTITISMTDAAGTTSLLSTKTATFYSSVAKLEVSSKVRTILRAGSYWQSAADLVAELRDRSAVNIPSVVVKMTDSSGRLANSTAEPTVVSGNTAVISAGTCGLDDGLDTVYSSGLGVGYYNCGFQSATSSKSGDKATVTIRIANPADGGLTYLTTTVELTIGGSVAKEVITLNKATYAPGENMQIKITATDSSGNPVYDGAATPAGVVASKSAIGIPTAADVYTAGSKTWGALGGVFAPAQSGTFTITADGTDAAATSLTASASVTDANAGLMTQIDALNAKIVALNALIAKIMKKLGVK